MRVFALVSVVATVDGCLYLIAVNLRNVSGILEYSPKLAMKSLG